MTPQEMETKMNPKNLQEWDEVLDLLAQTHNRHPSLTIGEMVQIASVLGEGVSPWGAWPGAVVEGLREMLKIPAGAYWRPDGTWDTPRAGWRRRLQSYLDAWRRLNPRPERLRGSGFQAWKMRMAAWEQLRQAEVRRWTAENPRPEPTPEEVAEAEALEKLGAKIAGVIDAV